MTARVRDAYVAGRGILVAKLFGLLTVADQQNTPEMAQGELIRFFAEGTWYPTALLPSQGVVWEAIDDTRAAATLTLPFSASSATRAGSRSNGQP